MAAKINENYIMNYNEMNEMNDELNDLYNNNLMNRLLDI